jgi:4-hydroxy-2-oxoheptanedioate aldolase
MTQFDTELGAWSLWGTRESAAALAVLDFDWIGLDAQHGRFDDARVIDAVAGIRAVRTDLPGWVRGRSNDDGLIGRALDAGANGVIVPMVDDAAQAASAVAASSYAPHGRRSLGPSLQGGGYTQSLGETACAVMVETATGLANCEAIAQTPGLHMIFVGPWDLALALGLSLDELLALEGDASPLVRIAAACTSAKIRAGAYAGTPERGRVLQALGFEVVAIATEDSLFAAGAASVLS